MACKVHWRSYPVPDCTLWEQQPSRCWVAAGSQQQKLWHRVRQIACRSPSCVQRGPGLGPGLMSSSPHFFPLDPADALKTAAKAVCTAAGAALGGYVTLQLKSKRQSAAIIELANLLVGLGDPTLLTHDQVAAIEAKYGTTLMEACPEEVKAVYGTLVEALIPKGDAALSGSEHILIQNFKAALGLTDNDAAPVHMDVGRRVLRGRLEAGTRGEDMEARKTFQKLIYVSSLVFGERQSAFLLPWARVFGLTDAQVQVARRDNARSLFKQHVLAAGGLQADRAALAALLAYQQQIRLTQEESSSVVSEALQARLQSCMETAIECVKRRTRVRDYTDVLTSVREAVDYNRAMASFKGDAEVPAGVGPSSLAGTAWESSEGRSKDLREVFRWVWGVQCAAALGLKLPVEAG